MPGVSIFSHAACRHSMLWCLKKEKKGRIEKNCNHTPILYVHVCSLIRPTPASSTTPYLATRYARASWYIRLRIISVVEKKSVFIWHFEEIQIFWGHPFWHLMPCRYSKKHRCANTSFDIVWQLVRISPSRLKWTSRALVLLKSLAERHQKEARQVQIGAAGPTIAQKQTLVAGMSTFCADSCENKRCKKRKQTGIGLCHLFSCSSWPHDHYTLAVACLCRCGCAAEVYKRAVKIMAEKAFVELDKDDKKKRWLSSPFLLPWGCYSTICSIWLSIHLQQSAQCKCGKGGTEWRLEREVWYLANSETIFLALGPHILKEKYSLPAQKHADSVTVHW